MLRTEVYNEEKESWIGTDGTWLPCPRRGCQCFGCLHAGEPAEGLAKAAGVDETE